MSAAPGDAPATARHDPTRRLVVAATATALAVPFLAPLSFAAATETPSTPAQPPAEPNDLEARADALLGYLTLHFAPHLPAGPVHQDVRRDLTGLLRAAAALRGVELANHEEPDFLFAAAPRP